MNDLLIAVVDRPLTDADMIALDQPRHVKPTALVRIRARHHRLARLLAEGFSSGEAALACNLTVNRVSILLDDPTFAELVTHYRQMVNTAFLDLQERLSEIAQDAAEILADRMEKDPEGIETTELMKAIALGADRTGHGPSMTQNHNHMIGFADRLERARERAKLLPPIDVEVINVDSQ
jgi:hypothetical protein